MPSERIQRRIDGLLDQAEEAADQDEWGLSARRAQEALNLDPDSEDAQALLTSAEQMLGGSGDPARPAAPVPATPQPVLPISFASGRYEVREFLGEGGKKRVFLAHDTSLDRDVAFALIRTEGLDATGRERVAREAQAMGRLGAHPHLVTIHDIGEESGQPYIVMEHMAQGSLATVLDEADGRLPLERTLEIAKSVCRALEFVHSENLVHRDLKPGNVFVAGDGTAKIGDFGLAVALDRTRLTQESSMMGTANYMPPEQALGGEITACSDLYSLGAMLYEMVAGSPPFVGDDPTAVISQHINTMPVAPSWHTEHCPPDLEMLILRLLSKVPDDRPASASEVLSVLESVNPEDRSASHSDSGANPLDRLAQGVFVGRQAELERLRSAFDRAFAGQGNMAMLVGEPGSGKTRTSMELETYARMRGAQVLLGRTHESEGMPSYWPWIEVARVWGNANEDLGLPPEVRAELVRIIPELRERGAGEPEEITDAEAGQFRLFDAFTTFMRAASEKTPLLIVLDDLHWSDKPSLLLLQHFARSLSRMRVLVVGTYRDTDLVRTHPLSEALASLNRETGFDRVVLRGLSRDEVGSYIAATAHIEPPRALVDRIHEETEGNPFFLSEVVNLMTQEGTLSADSVSDIALPDGVKEALGRRLDRISEEANELLKVAAVEGREFRFETLSVLGDHDEEELLSLIEEGLDARVIEETGAAGQYRFTHALMQETLLDELSTTRRVRLHGRIGEALEQRWGERADERATRLASHFVEAATLTERHAGKAMRYSKLAAEQAEMQAGWGEAARRYEDCITLVTETEAELDEDEASLLVAAGRCHLNANAQRDAWRRLLRARDLYRERGDARGMARATLEADRVNAPPPRRVALIQEALETLGDADAHLEAQLRALLLAGRLAPLLDDTALAQHRQRASELAERHGFEDVRVQLVVADAGAAYAFEEATRLFLDAARRLDALGFVGEAAEAHLAAITTAILTGHLAEARDIAEDGIAYARRYHVPFAEENAAGFYAGLLLGMCDFDRLDAVLDEHAGAASYQVDGAAMNRALLRGDLTAARDALPSPEPVAGLALETGQVRALRARTLLAVGETAEAKDEFARVREAMDASASAVEFDGIKLAAGALGALGDAVFGLADDAFLRAWFSVAQGQGDLLPYLTTWGNSPRVLYGRIALALEESGVAEWAFSSTLEWAEREGAPVIAGQCHQGLAEVAIRGGETAEAAQHLDAALDLFQQHGAKLYLDQVIAKKLELQGAASADVRTSIEAVAASIGLERPDLASQVAPDGTVTLLFSDIEGSTALNTSLGDRHWMELLNEHNALVRDCLAVHGGFEVKTEGDGFMVAFQSARNALNCAIAMQRTFSQRNDGLDDDGTPINVRIGLHTGEPVAQGDDFYGVHVVMASRIADQADGGEVLVSSLLRELVASSGEFTLEAREPVTLKGLDGEHVTYAVG